VNDVNFDLIESVFAWTITSGAGIYVAKWLGTKFIEWLQSYNTRLKAVENSVVKVGDEIDKRLIKIETTLDLIKGNKPVDEHQVLRIFEDNIIKIVRKKLNKH
jgi:hypothetical protein